jgi:hypothetical protein
MTDRKRVWAEESTISIDNSRAIDIIQELQAHVQTYGDSVKVQERSYGYYGYDGGTYFAIMVERDENDDEMKFRREREESVRIICEERDRKEFQRLQQKFKS